MPDPDTNKEADGPNRGINNKNSMANEHKKVFTIVYISNKTCICICSDSLDTITSRRTLKRARESAMSSGFSELQCSRSQYEIQRQN